MPFFISMPCLSAHNTCCRHDILLWACFATTIQQQQTFILVTKFQSNNHSFSNQIKKMVAVTKLKCGCSLKLSIHCSIRTVPVSIIPYTVQSGLLAQFRLPHDSRGSWQVMAVWKYFRMQPSSPLSWTQPWNANPYVRMFSVELKTRKLLPISSASIFHYWNHLLHK